MTNEVLETTRYKIYADLKDGVGVRFIKVRVGKDKADKEVDRLIHGKAAASRAYAIVQ